MPPGFEARSTIRLPDRSRASTPSPSTGAGMVFTTVSKAGASPARAVSGAARRPRLSARARCSGRRAQTVTPAPSADSRTASACPTGPNPSTSTSAPHRVRVRCCSRMPMQPSAVGMALYTASSGRAK